MSATLTHIQISNYRSCVDTNFQLSPYTALVGYNNSGKSNILSAMQWLLRRSSLGAADFCNPDSGVSVIGTFGGISPRLIEALLPDRQRAQILPYIKDGVLSVRRTQEMPGAKAADIVFSVYDWNSNEWRPNPTGIDNAIAAIFPDPIRIGAMENAAEDASKSKTTTTIGKLLMEFIAPLRRAHESELSGYLQEISGRISADGAQRLPELSSLDAAINQKIADLFPDISLRLDFLTPSFDDLIRAGTVKVYEGDGLGRGFSSYGHGAQRSIQMALVRHLAELRQGEAASNTTLLLIDEPELYLHPFAIEHVRCALKSLSMSGYQVIFSTHSAQMIPASDAQNVLLIRKSAARGTHSRRRLLDAIQAVVPGTVHQMEHLFALSNSSQMLFAEQVILTEGKTEHRLLPRIFQLETSRTLAQCKLALISQDGVNNTKKSRDILHTMDIPSKAIVDLDYAFRGAISHGYIAGSDPDLVALKALIPSIASANNFMLDGGLPKNASISAAEAYEIIAADARARPFIESLCEKLKCQGIWIWRNGAIEKHLGLGSKTESEWAAFIDRCERNGLCNECSDPGQVEELIRWMQS